MTTKYIAPPWIKYPTNPEKSEVWKTGSCAEYLIKFNRNVNNMDEYLEMFPKAPTFTDDITPGGDLSDDTVDFLEDPSRPLFIKLWTADGKPRYESENEISSNAVIMLDTVLTDKTHIHIGKDHFDTAGELITVLESEYKSLNETLWDELKYTFFLNALYYKIVSDINFTKELIKTGDNPIIFKSSNLEWGIEENTGKIHGMNLLGLAMMEIRDVIRDVYKNYDSIDWNLSGEPYTKERCMCSHHAH